MELEAEGTVLDAELVGNQLFPGLLMAGDHAGHGFRAGPRVTDSHGDVIADPQPLTPWLVGDLDLDRPYLEAFRLLPRPREVLQRVAAEPSRVDALERLPLRFAGGVSTYSTKRQGDPGSSS